MRASASLTEHLKNGKQQLPLVPELQRLSASVFAVLGMNPGPYALTGTNTYLVGTGAKRILIDTGEGRPGYIANLEKAMASVGATGIQEIVLTHWHFDHLGGVPSVVDRFGDVPVRKFMPEVKEPLFGGEGGIDPYIVWPEDKFIPLVDGEVLRTEGAALRVLYTPGHANDHVVLIHEGEKAMFTGDNVLGVGTTMFRDLSDYMVSLDKMQTAVSRGRLTTLYPAHGPVVRDAASKLAEYISHRQQRVDQVRRLLQASPAEGVTCEEITREIYAEIPDSLLPAAAGNTFLVLLKLERDRAASRLAVSQRSSQSRGLLVDVQGARWVPKAASL